MDRYEEALERAKAGKPMDEVFPELRESEDERIRKNCIHFLELQKKHHADTSEIDDCISYLEKQKDERELSFIEGKMEGVRQTCQEIKDAMSLFESKDLTPFEFTFRDYIDSAIRYCLAGEGYQQYIKEWAADLLNLERRNEQKPVKLNDDTEVGLNRALQIVKDARGNLCGYQSDDGIYECCHAIQTLERILKNGVEQNPAEWNDTDMKEARGNLISVCRDWECGKQTTLLPIVAIRARYFLEHLTEPKPAEWSEEDEDTIEKAICVLEANFQPNEEFMGLDIKRYQLVDRLKSLRPQPHWKPSEEQMRCLRDFVNRAREMYNVSTNGYDAYPALISLYDDLKKL